VADVSTARRSRRGRARPATSGTGRVSSPSGGAGPRTCTRHTQPPSPQERTRARPFTSESSRPSRKWKENWPPISGSTV